MPKRPTRNRGSHALFNIATNSGEKINEILSSARKSGERSDGRGDNRISAQAARLQADEILERIRAINKALPLLAIEWFMDPNLKRQIEAEVEPIRFPELETREGVKIEQYAGMLAITAAAHGLFTEGVFDNRPVWARPNDTPELVVRRYEAEAGPLEQSHTWQDYQEEKSK